MTQVRLCFVPEGFACDAHDISAVRAEIYGRIAAPEHKRLYAASSAALYRLLGDAARTFRYGENGRPEVDGGSVSLSHTAGLAVCAACDAPVGIDIERRDRALTPNLQRWFHSIDDWVAAEACVKMTGEGIAAVRRYVRDGSIMRAPDGSAFARIKLFDRGDHRVCVCCPGEFEIKIIE